MKLLFSFPVLLMTRAPFRPSRADEDFRAGIIGLDTSHVIAFTKLRNDVKSAERGAPS